MKLIDFISMVEMFPEDAELKFMLPGALEIFPVGLTSTIQSEMPERGTIGPFPPDATLTLTVELEY